MEILGFSQTNEVVKLEGRVSPRGTNLIFQVTGGEAYQVVRNNMSEALFVDTNLLSKVLVLTGKTNSHSFEVTGNLRSIKNGKLHELYYYCDICSIQSSLPGLCQCCREPSVLVEEPVK